jgi:FkbM family methyltransferase
MMEGPIELIKRLARRRAPSSINWEGMLAEQYTKTLAAPRTIIDVGCNEGAHVWHFLSLHARSIICFEPIPALASKLRERFAGHSEVVIHQAAVGARNCRSLFMVNEGVLPESGLRARGFYSNPSVVLSQIEVRVVRLDDLALRAVDYIKIDCEGGELDVLAGAAETIGKWRPLISVEYGAGGYDVYGHRPGDLFAWGAKAGYAVVNLFGQMFVDEAAFVACVDRYYWDYLLVPRERGDLIAALRQNGERIAASLWTQ